MGKLTALAPSLSRLTAKVAPLEQLQKVERLSWRAWYSTSRWKKLRQAILLRDRYTCRMCGKLSSHGMVIDHREPHKGDEALFWDERNLQVLCKSPCHDKHKQAMEAAGRSG